jgi:hypothetical protein
MGFCVVVWSRVMRVKLASLLGESYTPSTGENEERGPRSGEFISQ